ncbi:unannotated protein [freshwater metagenome]|uniref:Unannotated protein n=1 Tax=freshwater metagenome TaxID=449393 RepID=A0A6J7IG13_9ZZZZ
MRSCLSRGSRDSSAPSNGAPDAGIPLGALTVCAFSDSPLSVAVTESNHCARTGSPGVSANPIKYRVPASWSNTNARSENTIEASGVAEVCTSCPPVSALSSYPR